jgi:dTDP-4-amino-4,6-dideoxygalactose transaminase
VFHLYVIRTPDRDAVQAKLRAAGIGSGIHYPMPVHLQPAYRDRVALGVAGCVQTEIAASQVLSLPLYPELTDDEVAQVAAELKRL